MNTSVVRRFNSTMRDPGTLKSPMTMNWQSNSQLVEQIGQLIGDGRRKFAGRTVQADDNERYVMADDLHCQQLELRVATDVDG